MPDITVLIPVSPYHIDLLPRALASVRAQTYPCETVIFYDEFGKGAGYARNEALKQVKTELVIFLDADDELFPEFAAHTLALYRSSGRYIYTDWQDELGTKHSAPDCAWVDKSFHLITTLLPTAWAKAVNGFDEKLPAGEDSEFYTHLVTAGYCGIHLAETLVTYTHYGQRSQNWFASEQFARVKHEIETRYGGKRMGCCDGAPLSPVAPMGERVLVMPTWGLGTRDVNGQATGTRYGRFDGSTPPILMDRRDAAIRPDLYRIIEAPKAPVQQPQPTNGNGFHALVQQLVGAWDTPKAPPAPPPYVPTPAPIVDAKPDVARVLRLTGTPAIVKRNADPVFVFPNKDYPSYTDVRRLVELSGFEISTSFAAYNAQQTYIILSPEQPDEYGVGYQSDADARLIWWALEYGGTYEADLLNWHGEVWASDPTWAKAHDAKFVVMGSHPELSPLRKRGIQGTPFDVTLLGYMTPRREALKAQLKGVSFPEDAWGLYPGYGDTRTQLLDETKLMLHAHQDDQRQAIAPQRFALCAAYHLPLIHEAVPDEGAYAGAALFAHYDELAQVTRDELRSSELKERGEALYQWLCEELTFRKSVEVVLK